MTRNRIGSLSLLLLLVALTACKTASTMNDEKPPEFDTQSMLDTGEYIYQVRTDSDAPIPFDIRMSNASNDVNCEQAFIFSSGSVSAAEPSTRHFNFSQMGSPHVALYEWHLCFVVDGVTYKAWRGFDPGPNSALDLDCNIPMAALDARDTESYLCRLRSVSLNRDNYADFAISCDGGNEKCRRFESAEEWMLWRRFHEDPQLQEKLVLAYFRHELREMESSDETYLAANRLPVFLALPAGEPSESLVRKLQRMGLDVSAGSTWQAGKGMKLSMSDIEPLSDSSVVVTVSTYCGALCGSGTRVFLTREDGNWKVTSMELDWIS